MVDELSREQKRDLWAAGYHCCATCGRWKYRSDFAVYHSRHCDDCVREQNRKAARFRRTGADHWVFEDAIKEQGDKCPICGDRFVYVRRHAKEPHQDHKHVLGEKHQQTTKGYPREVLCRDCNLGVGKFERDDDAPGVAGGEAARRRRLSRQVG